MDVIIRVGSCHVNKKKKLSKRILKKINFVFHFDFYCCSSTIFPSNNLHFAPNDSLKQTWFLLSDPNAIPVQFFTSLIRVQYWNFCHTWDCTVIPVNYVTIISRRTDCGKHLLLTHLLRILPSFCSSKFEKLWDIFCALRKTF